MAVATLSCKSKSNEERLVSVSILPQKYFVEKIADNYVKVNVMIPPGMSPASCDLQTEQLKKLYNSSIYFAIGHLPFETTHLYPVLDEHKNIKLINHSDNIPLLEGSCNHSQDDHNHVHSVDPHIWMSTENAHFIIWDIYKALANEYPEKQDFFRENAEKFDDSIKNLNTEIISALKDKSHRSFLIYHPALTYFADEFNLEQISIENEGKEPSPAHLQEIIEDVKAKDIHIVFIQSQFDEENAKAVAKETNCEVIGIDPLNPDWTAEMKRLTEILQKKL
jgi:zinc transport system substrate-binding protein